MSRRDHCILIALGVLSSGRKLVLGLREGSTENSAVVRSLLADLVERCWPSACKALSRVRAHRFSTSACRSRHCPISGPSSPS